jgi:hypothetical protein
MCVVKLLFQVPSRGDEEQSTCCGVDAHIQHKIPIFVHVCTLVRTHVHTFIHTYIHIFLYMHAYIHTQIHRITYTHTTTHAY